MILEKVVQVALSPIQSIPFPPIQHCNNVKVGCVHQLFTTDGCSHRYFWYASTTVSVYCYAISTYFSIPRKQSWLLTTRPLKSDGLETRRSRNSCLNFQDLKPKSLIGKARIVCSGLELAFYPILSSHHPRRMHNVTVLDGFKLFLEVQRLFIKSRCAIYSTH